MHRGPRHGRPGGHRHTSHRPRVSISTGRNRHYRSGRSYSRGIFRIIISALFFRSIMNLASTNPEKAKSTCSKYSSIGNILIVIGILMFVAPIIVFFTSTSQSMSSALFAVIVVGMFILLFGSAMSREASYAYSNCQTGNFENSNFNGSSQYNQPTQQAPTNKTCAYCGTSNPHTNNYCNACGASL
ncbi:MAG: hypothetical protein R3Y60_00185 [bacterium]